MPFTPKQINELRLHSLILLTNSFIVMVTFAEKRKFETACPKQVLLVCKKGQLQEQTLHYALNLCQRIGATLDILYLSTAQQCFEALVRYVKKQTTITCTVMSSVDGLDITNQWTISGCPLIIVKESVLGNIN